MNRIMIVAMAVVVAFAGMAADADAGLFDKLKCRRAAKKCCKAEPCCEAAPEPCCEPAPAPCCEPAPAPACEPCAAPAPAPCGCEAAAPAPCGCEAAAPAPSCGCEVATTCGCEAPAPADCGCEAAPACEADCNCLSRRQLRKAKRKGQCCDAEPKTCYTCSAPVSTCGCEVEVAAPADCGCTGTIIESAPVEAEAEEAAPEAPEASAT